MCNFANAMNNKILSFIAVLLCPLALAAQKRGTHDAEVARNLQVFNNIYRMLDMYYVDTLSADTTMEWAIQGMLRRVDPFTQYYRDNDDELRQMAKGTYAGIGSLIRYSKRHDRVTISQPYTGTPSMEAGLRPGDVLWSVDGRDTKGMAVDAVSKMLRGDAGTTLHVKVKRPGEGDRLRSFTLTRKNIQLPQLPYYGMMDDSVGYVLLSGFTEGVALEMRHAVSELKAQGMQRMVLDLRDNPGGVIDEAVNITNLFVPKGRKVVYTRGKVAAGNREYYTTSEPLDTITPMVVLVDGGSASAAEILSGALQDMDRAVVMGTRTYGKGLVQTIRELPYGTNIKLTISRYYIPSGRCIQAYDYRHLNPDGSVGTVPDSLTNVFHTMNGREVRDGGGIKPDVEVRPDSLPSFVYDVASSEEMFDYATEYVLKHKEIAPAGDFHLSDADYESFADYMQQSGFTANRRSEEVLKLLKSAARWEGYYTDAQAEFEALEAKLTGDVRQGIMKMKEQIRPYLENEIACRYYHEAGAVRQQLSHDKVYDQAVQLLSDTEKMNKILKP